MNEALQRLRGNAPVQLLLGLAIGVGFGACLQIAGVPRYDVIVGQLRLTDFPVVKVMRSAGAVGTVGVYLMRGAGLADLHIKPGSVGATVVGGIIFGAGFAVLGYCPGTVAGAVGSGALDALVGGVTGILIGAGIFAALYPRLEASVLGVGALPTATIPDLLRVNPWAVVVPLVLAIAVVLYGIELAGL
jgi:hypothetical protein